MSVEYWLKKLANAVLTNDCATQQKAAIHLLPYEECGIVDNDRIINIILYGF